MKLHMRFRAPLAVALGLIIVVGCSKPESELSGTVQYNAKSIATGTVTVYDSDMRPFQGAIEQGSYTIKKIPPGPVTVVITSPDPNESAEPRGADARGGRELRQSSQVSKAGWFPIPKRYGDQGTTDFKTELKAGPNTLNLELKD